MKILCTLNLLLIFLLPGAYSQPGEAIDWDYEIDLLARELAGLHPDLFFRTDSAWYFEAMKEVAHESKAKSLFQVAVRLQQVLASMGDAQTQVNYHFLIEKPKILPLELYWFQEGIYILETERAYEPLLGKKLTAINQFPLEVVIDSLSSLLVHDSEMVLKNQVPRMLGWFQLLEYFGFAGGKELTLRAEGPDGEIISQNIQLPVVLGEMLSAHPSPLPLGWQQQKEFFTARYFDSENLYYIQYNRCWSREAEEDHGSGASALFMPSFKEFEKEVYAVVKKLGTGKLVFDLRFNKGGYAGQGSEFIRKISKSLPRDHGEIFVLLGRATEGAAIINAVDFMQNEEVVLVGEATGGRPNFFGEVKRFVLPESRLIVSYPTMYFHLLEDDPPAIFPDVTTPLSFDSYSKGVDSAMKAVFEK